MVLRPSSVHTRACGGQELGLRTESGFERGADGMITKLTEEGATGNAITGSFHTGHGILSRQ